MAGPWQSSMAILLTGLLLAGCAGRSGASVGGSKPVDAYVLLGGRIKTCWFNPLDPLLPDYVYRADVSTDGSKVKISVHQRQDLGRAGLTAYTVEFNQEGPLTIVTTDNRKMPPHLAEKMQYDIDRWKRGESNCSKEMPTTASIPAAAPTAAQ